MALDHRLISQFAKLVNSDDKKSSESTVYGTVKVDANGNKYVQLDGSDQLTPLTEENQPSVDTASAKTHEDDRVSVLIKDHTATVTGNISSPAVSDGDVETAISKYDIVVAEKIQAEKAYLKKLIADDATIGKLEAGELSVTDLIAARAEIDNLIAQKVTVTDLIAKKIDADVVVADNAIIDSLKANNANILSLIADNATIENLIATKATINSLITKKLDATWANIDFADIDMAKIGELFSTSGIIKDLTTETGTVTGELVGVTIKGSLIEGGTIKADKLVVKGSDGIYYKLNIDAGVVASEEVSEEQLQNGLHGDAIIAKTITAEKIKVSDLVAFGATIGGFHITSDKTGSSGKQQLVSSDGYILQDKNGLYLTATEEIYIPGSIFSGVKNSVDNTTRGIYMDTDGQIAVGDGNNFIKFSKDENGNYELEVVAGNIQDQLDATNKNMIENTAALKRNADSIFASVSSLETRTDDKLASIDEQLGSLRKDVDLKVTDESVEISIQKAISNGVTRVDTGTGITFDESGMVVDKIDKDGNTISPTSTNINDNGMLIKDNQIDDPDKKNVLIANKDGVKAKDLEATTYLVIGGRSRFENYGNKRTACFWIGE